MSTTASIDPAVTKQVADAYFAALVERDVEAAVALWQPGGRENVRGQVDTTAPDGVRAFLGGIFASFPDFAFTVLSTTTEDDRCSVRWTATATFAGPAPFHGIEPTGARVTIEGVDELTVRDGRIVENNAYADGAGLMRSLGVLPPEGSKQETRMTGAFNTKTRVTRQLGSDELEAVADGVWLLRGGFPGKTMNVYFVRDDAAPQGVLMFDAGVRQMTNAARLAAVSLGGLTRVVLGHGHADHRGVAPAMGVSVFCHPEERADAEADGGEHYFHLERLNLLGQTLMPRLLTWWDGGPVQIAGTVDEGDEIAAGFRVVHLPGHAPGMMGLWREGDGVALTSDCFYTLDPQTGRKGHPRVPNAAFNLDTEQARASIRKLAALRPSAAWPGHADPLRGDVAAALEQAAATT